MSKIALVQPCIDDRYGRRHGYTYASKTQEPETGLAVLASYLRTFAPNHEVVCLNPNKSDEAIARKAAKFDLIGFTDWFSNHRRVIDIARLVKDSSPGTQIVLGGPNTQGISRLVLEKYQFIDYVVVRDGEDALLGLANRIPENEIPNLWYRDGKGVCFTQHAVTDLCRLPLWDFSDFEDLDERLAEHHKAMMRCGEEDFDPWLAPLLTMFSFRGCPKATRSGVCKYCTTAETTGRALSPEQFWAQLKLLRQKHGAGLFYMADDIFPVSLRRMEQLAEAKPKDLKTPMFRAYGYIPDFIRFDEAQMERMISALSTIGVGGFFFGVESFGLQQITRANKEAVDVVDCERVIKALGASGIKTTMAYLLGLPGETEESLRANLDSLSILLPTGYIERVFVAIVLPLRGTAIFQELLSTPAVVREYEKETGNELFDDDCPDYSLLKRLGVEHLSGLEPERVSEYLGKMVATSERCLKPHRVFGFLLER